MGRGVVDVRLDVGRLVVDVGRDVGRLVVNVGFIVTTIGFVVANVGFIINTIGCVVIVVILGVIGTVGLNVGPPIGISVDKYVVWPPNINIAKSILYPRTDVNSIVTFLDCTPPFIDSNVPDLNSPFSAKH